MWEILGLLSLGLVGVLVHRQRLRAWQDIAASCGLEVVKVSSSKLLWMQLEAQAGPAAVRIESSSPSQGYTLRIVATFPRQPGLVSSLKIRRRLGPGAHELEVGDELFDKRFSVEGSTRLMTALLDEETRRLLLGVNFQGELEISGSEILLNTFDGNLRALLPLLLALIRRLTEDVDTAERLVRNARHDPAAGVRLRNLLALVRELPEDARTLETLRAACSDPSPRVRLRAVRQLGAERHDILFELAEGLEDDAVSAEAISILSRELSFERTKAILDRALDRSFPKTARACLEALGQQGASPGQLSLAATDAGQLSLAPDEAGQLSLAPSEPDQLALAEDPPHTAREAPDGQRG